MKVEQVITIQMLHLIDMEKIITTLLVLVTLPICSYAQGEVKDTISVDVQEIRDTVEVQTNDVVELQKKIKELTDKVNTLTESENNLKGKQFEDKQKIEAQEIIIKRLKQRLVFADSIVAR